MRAAPTANAPRRDVREGVRALLQAAEGFGRLDQATRRDIASSLVRISSTALQLARAAGVEPPSAAPQRMPEPVLAAAQSAGRAFSGTAVDRVAPTTQRILNAVSFPRFVGELITGVFKAMNESNEQQLSSYVELIRNVAATTEGFADANIGLSGARSWLAERFPANFVVRGAESDDGFGDFDDPSEMTAEERAERQAERDAETRLELRPGASMPSEAALRTALGLPPGESVPGNPEALVAPVRAALARNRQQMLATMVMMGMQRIVIDRGRIDASMRFHIDAASAAADDRGSRFDMRNTIDAGGKFQMGPWGAEARIQNTIGYVSTEKTQTEEELNVDLDLNSSVQLVFKTDYVPLNRLAGDGAADAIRGNALNPEAEAQAAIQDRAARRSERASERQARRAKLDEDLQTPPAPEPPPPIDPPEPPGAEEGGDEEPAEAADASQSDADGGDQTSETADTDTGGDGENAAEAQALGYAAP